jgi:hypothetical protein
MGRSKPEPSFWMSAGRQINDDLGGWNAVAAVFLRRADTVAAFADGSIRQSDSVTVVFVHLDARNVHFHFDDVGVNTVNGGGQGHIKHREHQRAHEGANADGRFLPTS